MSREVPCAYCGKDLSPGIENLEEHLRECDKVPKGDVFTGRKDKEDNKDEKGTPESLPE